MFAAAKNRALFFLVLAILLAATIYPPGSRWGAGWDVQTLTSPVEENNPLDPDLPYKVYRYRQDSLQRIENAENRKFDPGNTYLIGGLGISLNDDNPVRPYHFFVDGYRLEEHVSIVHRQNKTYLRYPVWNEIVQRGGIKERSGHVAEKEVALNFFPDRKKSEVLDTGSLAFPAGKTAAVILRILFMVAGTLFAILGLYYLLYIPFQVLSLISRGQFFSEELTGGLYRVGGFLLFLGLVYPLTVIPAHLILGGRVPEGIGFSYYAALMKHWEFLVAGGVVLLLAGAFRKGAQLQNEQDLTV